MNAITVIGTLGAACILVGFLMVQLHRWKPRDHRTLFINLLGAVLLLIYALILRSFPFVILNIVWGAIALAGILHLKLVNRR